MTVCKFYLQGNCKFGDRCRFEHPAARNQPQTNRFGAFGSGGGSGGGGGGRADNALLDKYRLDFDNIEKDLTSDAPQWILSAYAPGRDAPKQLFGGPLREQSFEEMRLHFLQGKAAGNEQAALNQAQELYQDAQKQMQNAVRNLNDAVQYVLSGENEHPNRHDICREGTQGAPFGVFLVEKRRGAFGSNSPATNNPFSTTSATPSAFGGAAPQTSAFGQPSAMGARPNPFATPSPSPFGQQSQPSQGSAFGQAAPQTQGSAFGQPSAMGAKPNPFGTPTFGQAASATGGSAFGQPSQSQSSPFGQPSQPQGGGAFGQAMQTQGSAFGLPSQMGAKPNPFAASTPTPSPFSTTGGNAAGSKPNPFAQDAQSQPKPNPFAAATGGGSPSPFGQPASKPNPFATPSQTTTTPAANPFAAATNQTNAFAQAAQAGDNSMEDAAPTTKPNPFAQTPATGNAFGQPAAANPFASSANTSQPVGTPVQAVQGAGPYPPDSSKKHPDGYLLRDGFGNLSQFKGQRVVQKDGKPGVALNGQFVKIWFPDGPPAFNPDTALPAEAYDQETLQRWRAFEATGQFKDGIVPELPPPREATVWDF